MIMANRQASHHGNPTPGTTAGDQDHQQPEKASTTALAQAERLAHQQPDKRERLVVDRTYAVQQRTPASGHYSCFRALSAPNSIEAAANSLVTTAITLS
jgi:hypothetical protein